MGLGIIVWVVLLGGVAALVVWALRQYAPRGGAHTDPDALEILRRRYARGEVTREQYEQMKRDLQA
ncbi:MAG: SHOCT domain-containing protein [bacterium]